MDREYLVGVAGSALYAAYLMLLSYNPILCIGMALLAMVSYSLVFDGKPRIYAILVAILIAIPTVLEIHLYRLYGSLTPIMIELAYRVVDILAATVYGYILASLTIIIDLIRWR